MTLTHLHVALNDFSKVKHCDRALALLHKHLPGAIVTDEHHASLLNEELIILIRDMILSGACDKNDILPLLPTIHQVPAILFAPNAVKLAQARSNESIDFMGKAVAISAAGDQ